MRFECFVGLRYLFRGKRRSFLSVTTLISMMGVAVGVMALIVVIAVMSGFDADLKEKITGVHAHLFIESQRGIQNPQVVMEALSNIEAITGSAPFIHGQAMLVTDEIVHGVLLRGIHPQEERQVTKIQEEIIAGSFDLQRGEILLGGETARKFNLGVGDTLKVMSPIHTQGEMFRVGGIFHSGMYDYDLNLAFIPLEDAQRLFGMEGRVGGVAARVRDMYEAEKVKEEVQTLVHPSYRVLSWVDMNRNLFGALALEKAAMFVILTLIVCVACFNIASSLIMMVTEKTKDIGILKAIGSSNRSIGFIFSIQGFLIGLSGTFLGAAGGFGLCAFLKRYPIIQLPQDIYYIDRLPIQIQWGDSLIIVVAAIGISLLATVYPAWRASRLDPVEALRYE